MNKQSQLLAITDLCVRFETRRSWFGKSAQPVYALQHVNLTLTAGKILAIVGESGSGKTTLAKCIAGLQQPSSGALTFDTTGHKVQYVFQDPFGSLNPGMTVEQIVLEPLDYVVPLLTRQQKLTRLENIFAEVGLDFTQRHRYPHEFSGGQCQRIAIARALIADPALLICDEPVSALDVSVKAQVINLLHTLNTTRGLTQIFIAHDLWLARYLGHDVIVLFQGQVMEAGECTRVFGQPHHPYTQALLAAAPVAGPHEARKTLMPVTMTATATSRNTCAYFGRCPRRQQRCLNEIPALTQTASGTQVACFYPMEE